MQQKVENYDLITPTAKIAAPTHGGRAKCLQRLVRLDLPVPKTVALSFDAIKGIVSGKMPDLVDILSNFDARDTLCVRPSSESIDWGGPGAVLNIGMNEDRCLHLSKCDSISIKSGISPETIPLIASKERATVFGTGKSSLTSLCKHFARPP